MSVSAMNARLVLVAALLSTCSVSRETSDDSVKKIYASAGEAVVLPCQIYDIKGDFPTVEWSKEGLGPKNDTFVYRNGCEIFEEKNKDFQFRTSLFMSEVQKGNIALRISNVRPSDAGKHECSIILDKKRKVITTLELIVCAAPEPKLSVVPGDVQTVHCEVHSSLTHLIMRFLDHQEKEIYAEERKRHSSGCFSFTGRVKVPAASDRVTCRVHRPQTNQSRDAQIYFTAKCTKSCAFLSFFAGFVAGAVVAAAVGIGVWLLLWFKLYPTCAGRAASPPLDLQLQEKERIISVLREELEHIQSTQSPVARQPDQPDQPMFDVSPSQPSPDISKSINPHQFPNGNDPKPGASSNSNHSNSGSLSQEKDTKPGVRKQTAVPDRPMGRRRCPSLSMCPVSSDPSQDSSENESLIRSKSLSERHNLNGAKLQSSARTLNRYSLLADLAENST